MSTILHLIAPRGSRRRYILGRLQAGVRRFLSLAGLNRKPIGLGQLQWNPVIPVGLTRLESNHVVGCLSQKPVISIIVAVEETGPRWLKQTINSVVGQHYPHWDLIFVVDDSIDPLAAGLIDRHAAQDERIKRVSLSRAVGTACALNKGVEMAQGSLIAFLDPHDELTPDALTWIAHAHNKHPEARWFYSDEATVSADGGVVRLHYKPDFSPEYLLSRMYTSRLSVYTKDVVGEAGGLRGEFEGAHEHDLALRVSEIVFRDQVVHIPRILYRHREVAGLCARETRPSSSINSAGVLAVREALRRRRLQGTVATKSDCANHYQIELRPQRFPDVTLIIPTKNALDYLRACLTSIREKTRYPNYKIVIVDNQSNDAKTIDYLTEQSENGNIEVASYDARFNHSEMNNLAVRKATSDYVLLLNNDIEILSDDWLETLVATAEVDDSIAGVGGLLLYPDDTIQHGGLILGINGAAGHAHRHLEADAPGYEGRAYLLNETYGCTAGLLLLRRQAFLEVGGFDAENYPTSFNDVDLWIRLRRAGYRCLYNPQVRAIHYESKTRGIDGSRDARFICQLQEQWGTLLQRDPFYNPNLSLDNEQCVGTRDYPVDSVFDAAWLPASYSCKKAA